MRHGSARPTVAVVGAGAAGALVALNVCETAVRRGRPLDLVLVDPAPEAGRGTAYASRDPRHLLNVPVGNMSCHPGDPGHFHRWLCRHGETATRAGDFVPRYRFGSYVADTLGRAVIEARNVVAVRRLRVEAVRCLWPRPDEPARLRLADGGQLTADSVVLATGPAAGGGWIPQELREARRFVGRPWAPHALPEIAADPADVLLIGSGLTSVDLALSLDRPDRVVHMVSRTGLLPARHALNPLPPAPCPPELADASAPERLPAAVTHHLVSHLRATGDWRPAMDGLRPLISRMWQSLGEPEKAEFLRHHATRWNVLRHRMAPATAEALDRMRAAGRLHRHSGRLASVRPLENGEFATVLADGSRLRTGWVVDCTGPGTETEEDAGPLWRALLDDGLATPGPLGLGVATDDGRLRDAGGDTARPLYTLGAPRRGELWETTAIPEIRTQAASLADVLVPAAPARPRRRPDDGLGLPLTTTADAAAHHRRGLETLLAVSARPEDHFRRAVAADPGFALGYVTLALLGHECGADVDTARALARAQRCVRERGDERERSLVAAVTDRISTQGDDHALVQHLERHPADVLALGAVLPTIAFGGVVDMDGELAPHVLDMTASALGGHWFHTSLRAFVLQDQARYAEAAATARTALAEAPYSAHAAHALTHVHYETGDHRPGVEWLDRWMREDGRGTGPLSHFGWHAALHELALDDRDAVRRRWQTHLVPGTRVRGVRALVDSGSLLWRARMAGLWAGEQDEAVAGVLEAVPHETLERPATAFTALHVALVFAAAGDLPGLRRLAEHAAGADPAQRDAVAPLCEALDHVLHGRWAEAARGMYAVLPVLRRVGGSAAQREVVEDTLLHALAAAGRCEEAGELLRRRLDARSSPLDLRRQDRLAG